MNEQTGKNLPDEQPTAPLPETVGSVGSGETASEPVGEPEPIDAPEPVGEPEPVDAPEPARAEALRAAERDAQSTRVDQPVRSDEPRRVDEPQRTGPRSGPIVWGVLILVFCAWVLQRTVGTEAVDATTWLIGTLLGTGAVLLIVALGLILRRSR